MSSRCKCFKKNKVISYPDFTVFDFESRFQNKNKKKQEKDKNRVSVYNIFITYFYKLCNNQFVYLQRSRKIFMKCMDIETVL